jgi:hypothetical protein
MLDFVEFKKFKNFKDQRIDFSPGISLVAGGNNSGKTSLFQGLAIWEYCRTVVEAEKGALALTPGQKFQGVGISEHEFSPLNLPDLSHLWTNLKPQKTAAEDNGYTLRIKCGWNASGVPKYLEFGLALANDRLFLKTTDSNLVAADKVPRVAYLPPFAGISSREARLPQALRRRRVGEGLAGSVIRNSLLDLYSRNVQERKRLRGTKTRVSDPDLKILRTSDPWELVQQSMRTVFGAELFMSPFNEEYHSYIDVKILKGTVAGYKLTQFPNYKPRDLMVEGSGLLQWLSVFSLAVDPSVDVLLLDEPDAHLHPSLQHEMFEHIRNVAHKKVVLVATHSPEVLRWAPFDQILAFRKSAPPKYLKDEEGKVGLVAGIGSTYLPKLDAARRSRKIFFVEGEGDALVLKKSAELLGRNWDVEWVVWPEKSSHADRIRLSRMIAREIPGLRVLSLRDRDLVSINAVGVDLLERGLSHDATCLPLTWKRRNIESYLVWPAAIAAASGLPEANIIAELAANFGIAISATFSEHAAPQALLDVDGKAVLKHFGLIWTDMIPHMNAAWLPADLAKLLEHLGIN